MAKKRKHQHQHNDEGATLTSGPKSEPEAEGHAGEDRHEQAAGLNGHSGQRKPMSNKEYERALKPLQVELVKLQTWAKQTGFRAMVVFEGRDAAGKGGCIKAITERVSPRVFRIVALPAPTEREKTQLYMQRYFEHFPSAGEIMLFDRSWYNRAGVEHVLGYCTNEQYRGFLRVCPEVERVVIESGILLVKYWLEVGQDEQTRRFEERIHDGRKTWKLSPQDLESHRRWYDYSRARDAMFEATDTLEAPWYVIDAQDQKRARLNCIAHLLSQIPYEDIPSKPVKLPKRQASEGYVEPNWRRHPVPAVY
jgi:polyphosphate kinase 2